MHSLVKNSQLLRVAPNRAALTTFQLAAGVSDLASQEVDRRGYAGLAFAVCVGAMAAGATLDIKVQHSDTTTDGDFADVEGSAVTQLADTKDDKVVEVEVVNPKKRYYRLHFTRGDGGNTTIDAVLARLFNPENAPPAKHSTVDQQKVLNAPNTGTA
jgi:hypothetical protein